MLYIELSTVYPCLPSPFLLFFLILRLSRTCKNKEHSLIKGVPWHLEHETNILNKKWRKKRSHKTAVTVITYHKKNYKERKHKIAVNQVTDDTTFHNRNAAWSKQKENYVSIISKKLFIHDKLQHEVTQKKK